MAAIIVTITSTTGIVGNIFHRMYKNKVRKGIAVPSPKHRFWNEVYPILDRLSFENSQTVPHNLDYHLHFHAI